MGGTQQPYMYAPEHRSSSRYPQTTFDPKAVTRASWEPKPQKPKQEGPLISFNRHPDAHMVLNYRSNQYTSMSSRTKSWVKGLRRFQLVLRILHFIAAAGLLVLWILFDHVDNITAWVMRVTCGVVMCHAAYAIYHLARDAAGRTPGSSSAYSVFAAVTDLTTLVIYAFGAFTIHQNSGKWATRLQDQSLMQYFMPGAYYATIGAGGLHLISFAISLWLGVVFRKISMMPPDMNPLESHLTARPKHKKSKSSVSTMSTADEKRLSTPLESHRRSGVPYEDVSRPPSVPFMHTRTQSRDSNTSARNSCVDLASLKYELAYGQPARASMTSLNSKRSSGPRNLQRGSYTEIPLHETGSPLADDHLRNSSQNRVAKFTETWAPTDSMISRTNQRNRYEALNKSTGHLRQNKSYSAVPQRFNLDDSSDSEYDDENRLGGSDPDVSSGLHPNPLRSNPSGSELSSANSSPKKANPRMQTPFRPRARDSANGPALTTLSSNARRVSASLDIADQSLEPERPWKRSTDGMLNAEDSFFSRPYGELKSATPPVMVGSNRKVSSGNDYETKHQSAIYERRNVSGKIAEEGRAPKRVSHQGYFSSNR
ncbi:hypothetical protein NLU13_4949 [Sarocladium strictum]|uniref:Uncharacterized protein n=1 Tax=Sarocladium strictum TaxID=5046 RepID=A0AA39GKH9_SARSR|nr:hypothetical protein NLU13_4949 [Sarocladium strictum]